MRLRHLSGERLDEHHKAIIDYIKNNAGCSEKQVFDAMYQNGVCSKMTTVRKIGQLRRMDEIRDSLKEGERGFHKMYINDKNQFNRISAMLSIMEQYVEHLDNSISNISKLMDQYKGTKKDRSERPTLENLNAPLLSNDLADLKADLTWHVSNIKNMLEVLLIYSSKTHDPNDTQLLYKRIVNLLLKILDHSKVSLESELAVPKIQMVMQELQEKVPDKFPPFMIEKDLMGCALKEGIIKVNLNKELVAIHDKFKKEFPVQMPVRAK